MQPDPAVPTHPKAGTVLALGIVSLLLLGPFTGIPAIVIGKRVRREIVAAQNMLGDGMALTGLVFGWIGTVAGLLGVVLLLAQLVVWAYLAG